MSSASTHGAEGTEPKTKIQRPNPAPPPASDWPPTHRAIVGKEGLVELVPHSNNLMWSALWEHTFDYDFRFEGPDDDVRVFEIWMEEGSGMAHARMIDGGWPLTMDTQWRPPLANDPRRDVDPRELPDHHVRAEIAAEDLRQWGRGQDLEIVVSRSVPARRPVPASLEPDFRGSGSGDVIPMFQFCFLDVGTFRPPMVEELDGDAVIAYDFSVLPYGFRFARAGAPLVQPGATTRELFACGEIEAGPDYGEVFVQFSKWTGPEAVSKCKRRITEWAEFDHWSILGAAFDHKPMLRSTHGSAFDRGPCPPGHFYGCETCNTRPLLKHPSHGPVSWIRSTCRVCNRRYEWVENTGASGA